MIDGAEGALLTRTLAFCRELRAERLGITPGRILDALRAVDRLGWHPADDFRIALRANLVSSREEELAFDRAFARFWRQAPQTPEGHARLQARCEFTRGSLEDGFRETHPEAEKRTAEWSPDDGTRDPNLSDRFDGKARSVADLARELARRLATRPSRRERLALRGQRIDLRHSLRRSARYGMEILDPAYRERRIRKTRLVMLSDVSGSMDAYNPFLLELMFGLQKALPNSRTFVFSTRVSEITALLRHRSVKTTLRTLAAQVRHWSGGTDIGRALGELNRRALREGSPRRTVAVVISDGYDQGESARIGDEMRALQRRVRSVVWINPMLGSQTYQPTAQGMRAALPYVDHFLPAWDMASLRILVRGLARV